MAAAGAGWHRRPGQIHGADRNSEGVSAQEFASFSVSGFLLYFQREKCLSLKFRGNFGAWRRLNSFGVADGPHRG